MKHYPGAVSSIILGVVCNRIMVQYIIIYLFRDCEKKQISFTGRKLFCFWLIVKLPMFFTRPTHFYQSWREEQSYV